MSPVLSEICSNALRIESCLSSPPSTTEQLISGKTLERSSFVISKYCVDVETITSPNPETSLNFRSVYSRIVLPANFKYGLGIFPPSLSPFPAAGIISASCCFATVLLNQHCIPECEKPIIFGNSLFISFFDVFKPTKCGG